MFSRSVFSVFGFVVALAFCSYLSGGAEADLDSSTYISLKITAGSLPSSFQREATITVQVTSIKAAPNVVFEAIVPQGVSATPARQTFNLRENETKTLHVRIVLSSSIAKGNHAIYFRALGALSTNQIWGDQQALLFNIGTSGITLNWVADVVPVAENTTLGSTRPSDNTSTPWNWIHERQLRPTLPTVSREGGSTSGHPCTVACNSEGLFNIPEAIDSLSPLSHGPTVTLTGRWMYHDRSAVARPIDQQIIEIRKGDGSIIGSGLFPCFTRANGNFICTFPHPHSTMRVWVRSYTNFCNNSGCSDTDRLGSYSGPEVSCGSDSIFCSYPVQTGTITCAAGSTCNVGTWTVHTTVTREPWVGAFQISQDLIRSNKKAWFDTRHPGIPASPGDGKVNYPTPAAHTNAHYHRGSDKWIGIPAAKRSGDTVAHEYGHAVMDQWYAGTSPDWPVGGCPSPHYVDDESGSGCALSEGWANFWAAYSNQFYDGDNISSNDGPIKNWFGLDDSVNFETRGSSWETGDQVEGNVAGALWDIFDSTNDNISGNGIDELSNGFQHIWHVTFSNNHSNFAGWWSTFRTLSGHPACGAKRALWNNTIQYADPTSCSVTLGFNEAFNIEAFKVSGSVLSKEGKFTVEGTGIANLQVEVYNLAGQLIFDSGAIAGRSLSWNLLDRHGRQLANGIYLYVVTATGSSGQIARSEVKKLIILR